MNKAFIKVIGLTILLAAVSSEVMAGTSTITVLDSTGATKTYAVTTNGSANFLSQMGVCDGTAGAQCAAVKAASTAAVATDPAMVVAISPNNTVAVTESGTWNIATVTTLTGITNALPAGTNLLGKVGIDQTTVGTTNAVSLAQIGANTVLTGNGVSGTGSQRVNIASDNTAFSVNATLQASSATAIGTVNPTTATAWAIIADKATFTASTSPSLLISGQFTTGGATACATTQACAVGMTASRGLFTDLSTVNAVTVLTGTGAVGTGAQRIAVGTDTATIAGSAPGTAGSASANVITVQGIASMTSLLVNPGTIGTWGLQVSTQNSATPTNGGLVLGQFNTSPTTITTGNVSPLQMDNAGNLLVNIKAGASSGAVAQGSTTSGQTGGLTQAAAASAAPSYTTATTNPLSMDLSGNLRVVGAGLAQGSTTSGQTGSLILGAVTTSAPTYTTAQSSPLTLDTAGNLRVNVVTGGGSGGTSSTFGSAFPGTGTAIGLTNGTNMIAWSATSNYGTAPSAIAVPSVNAFVTNTNANGSAVSASSSPVVIASDQAAVAVKMNATPTVANGNGVVAIAATTGGTTTASAIVPANTTAVVVKSGAGTLYGIQVANINAAPLWVKFYNATSATCGSGTPVKRVMIPAASTAANGAGSNISFGTAGVAFGTGITYCITTGIADADTGTPTTANTTINVDYL